MTNLILQINILILCTQINGIHFTLVNHVFTADWCVHALNTSLDGWLMYLLQLCIPVNMKSCQHDNKVDGKVFTVRGKGKVLTGKYLYAWQYINRYSNLHNCKSVDSMGFVVVIVWIFSVYKGYKQSCHEFPNSK